ncbi:MAG: tripartite tricarboxylate transporter TctB family protein [Fretibacterium sp.]|nr:tripartite tricarboxylate transporter TctB family protein [Fretibacterium sp.]
MKKDSQYKLDIIPGVILAAFSIWYMAQVPGIRVFKSLGATPLTNHFIPYLWGSALLLLSAWLIVRGILKYRRFKARGGVSEGASLWAALADKREVIGSFIALALYVAFMDSVGFTIATIVYVFAQILILTPTARWGKNVLPAAATAVVAGFLLFYLFRVVLNVLLPVGLYGPGL